MARTKRGTALHSLHHVIDLDWMKEAYRLTRKDGAPGIDGVTAADYEVNLEANLLDLLSGRDGRLTRRSARCRTCSGPSVFIGCSISTYASTSIRFHTPTFERSLTNESRTASSEG